MPRSRFSTVIALAFGAAVALGASGPATILAAGAVPAYDAIPTVLPGNLSSVGFEAGRVSELGDEVTLDGTERDAADLPVTVVMSVWACGNGGFRETCATTPGQTFTQPITLNLYEVDSSGANPAPGALILTTTQSFTLAYRPSPDPVHCASADFYPWYSVADGTCFSGYAQEVTFDLSAFSETLPDSLIWGIAFNGQVSGYDPIGTQGPWNFLNLGTKTYAGQPAYGTDVEQDAVFMNSHYDWWYADGGAGGVDTFRRDTNWSNSRPLARFGSYVTAPVIADTQLVADDASGTEGGTTSLSATLKTNGVPVVNATIHFALGGAAAGDAVTNAAGLATLNNVDIGAYTAAGSPYVDAISSTFEGDANYGASGDTADLSIDVPVPPPVLPTITLTTPIDQQLYIINSTVAADYSCSSDSAIVQCAGPVADGAPIDTLTLGWKIFTVNARDGQGDTATKTVHYRVVFPFDYLPPTFEIPDPNTPVAAGTKIQIRFTMYGWWGNKGVMIGRPRHRQIDPITHAPLTNLSAGRIRNYHYDTFAQQYVLTWRTSKLWAGTTREFVVRLRDGTEHGAIFSFIVSFV